MKNKRRRNLNHFKRMKMSCVFTRTRSKFHYGNNFPSETRMHSSRMRTGRSLTVCWRLLPGGGGVPGPGGVPGQGDVPGPGGLWHPSMHWGRHPPPPLLTESQTPVKTLPWPNFVAAGNNRLLLSFTFALSVPFIPAEVRIMSAPSLPLNVFTLTLVAYLFLTKIDSIVLWEIVFVTRQVLNCFQGSHFSSIPDFSSISEWCFSITFPPGPKGEINVFITSS